MLTIYHKRPTTFDLSSIPSEPVTLPHYICMILVTFLDTGVILGSLREKMTAKKTLLVIFSIIAAAVLLSPSVAACPNHFTFKFVE